MPKNKERQRYFLQSGQEIAGVTTILNVYAKVALPNWANKLGREGIKLTEYLEERASIGTMAHDIIAEYFLTRQKPAENCSDKKNIEARECFGKFLEIEKKHEFEWIEIESSLTSEVYEFGGTPDYYGLIDGIMTVGDWKTSDGVYDNMIIQLGAYYMLLKENKFVPTRGAIFNIPPAKKKARVTFFSQDTLEVGFEVFRHLLEIYNLKRRLK